MITQAVAIPVTYKNHYRKLSIFYIIYTLAIHQKIIHMSKVHNSKNQKCQQKPRQQPKHQKQLKQVNAPPPLIHPLKILFFSYPILSAPMMFNAMFSIHFLFSSLKLISETHGRGSQNNHNHCKQFMLSRFHQRK